MESYIYNNIEYMIIVGKNKNDNWKLIDDSKDTYVWFHVANNPSSHVVLKTYTRLSQIPRQVIKRCACLCKSNSKSKSEKNCEIIYTNIKNVEKTTHIGEVTVTNTKKILI
jgi:predicted ribosome quality control (RQC) complex YloA/Tae2 family protein